MLDIGTTKIACLIARVDADGEIHVLGCDWRQELGVRGGSIVDLEKAERAIRACVGQAENMADTRLDAVVVNLTCGQPESRVYNVKWSLDAPPEGRPVTGDDVREVLREGRLLARAEGREPVHVTPLTFSLDNTENVVDPRGLYCSTLDARLHVVDASSSALRSLEACLRHCDLEIEAVVSAPMAAGLSVLVDDEREIGATVIDMGGGTTNVASFFEGRMIHSAQVRLGGLHVTVDSGEAAVHAAGPCRAAEDDVGQRRILARRRARHAANAQGGGGGSSSAEGAAQRRGGHHPPAHRGDLRGDPRQAGRVGPRARYRQPHRADRRRLPVAWAAAPRGAHPWPGGARGSSRVTLRGMPEIATGSAFATATGLLIWAANEGGTFREAETDRARAGWFQRLVHFLRDRV